MPEDIGATAIDVNGLAILLLSEGMGEYGLNAWKET